MGKRAIIEERRVSVNDVPLRFSIITLGGSCCKFMSVDAELGG